MPKTIEEYRAEWKRMTLEELQQQCAQLQAELSDHQDKRQAVRRTQMPSLLARHLAAVDGLIEELSQQQQ